MKIIAEKYIKTGLSVLPVKLNDKAPAIKSWAELQSKIIEDTNLFTGTSIGIIAGKISNNLEVLDFDNHGGTAKKVLSDFIEIPLIKEIYEKYKLPIVSTPSGGYHLFYRANNIEGNLKLATVLLNGKPDAIIETRGEGGYVVASPSKGYKVIKNDILNIQSIEENERTLIIEFAKSFNEYVKTAKIHKPIVSDDKPGNIYDADNSSIDEAKSILSSAGWIEKGNLWTRPGKKEGISATFGRVANNVFYVFSSNAEPFDGGSAYTPFSILALLKYNSDFKACASHLAERYELNKKDITINNKQPNKEDDKTKENKNLLKSCLIDLDKEYKEPPVFLGILTDQGEISRVCTPGNLSAITGKAKAKKSFLMSLFVAAVTQNSIIQNLITSELPDNKRQVLLFDTEQSTYDVYRVANRVKKLTHESNINLGVFSLRGLTADEIINLIEYALTLFNKTSMIFIDQVADLARSINDEKEAVKIVRWLEKLSKDKDLHICCVIHQNKGDNYASGWLGSQIMKKAETVISVEKYLQNNSRSCVKSALSRSMEFDEFDFEINNLGLPVIKDRNDPLEDNTNMDI